MAESKKQCNTEALITIVKSFISVNNTQAEVTNTLAYSTDALITTVKSFTFLNCILVEITTSDKHTSL